MILFAGIPMASNSLKDVPGKEQALSTPELINKELYELT